MLIQHSIKHYTIHATNTEIYFRQNVLISYSGIVLFQSLIMNQQKRSCFA